MEYNKWNRMGIGDLGFRVRIARFVFNRAGSKCRTRSEKNLREISTQWLDLVRAGYGNRVFD